VELKRRNAAVPLTAGKKAVYVDALNRALVAANEVNSDKENQVVPQPTTEPQPLPEYLNKLTVVRLKQQELKMRGLNSLSQATGIPVMKDPPVQQSLVTSVTNESSDSRVALAMVPPSPSEQAGGAQWISLDVFRTAHVDIVENHLNSFDKQQLAVQLACGVKASIWHTGDAYHWHGDTPLIAAVRGRNVPVVH
jgi:hypothetical protein